MNEAWENSSVSRGAVLITGAGSGIGEDAALYLNERGYTVFANVMSDGDGDRVEAKSKAPDRLHPVVFDVTNSEQVAAAVESVEGVLGPGQGLTGLFSNAGIDTFKGDLSCEGCPIKRQELVAQINYLGAVRVIQSFLPLLRAGRGTVVVNTAMMVHAVLPYNAGYAASKAALETWAVTLRREVAQHGVRVTAVRASLISTGLIGGMSPDDVKGDGPYPQQRNLIKTMLEDEKKMAAKPSCAPRRFSEIVAEAIESPKPKTKYRVGGGNRVLNILGHLPDRMQDRIFARMLKA